MTKVVLFKNVTWCIKCGNEVEEYEIPASVESVPALRCVCSKIIEPEKKPWLRHWVTATWELRVDTDKLQ